MKVRGIVFSGFMSAILMSVASAASVATVELAGKSYVDQKLELKQDVLKAGEGISITGNVIKSTVDTTKFVPWDEFEGLATRNELAALEKSLKAEIAAKHASGDYATAADLEALQNLVKGLQSGGVDKAAIESLQSAVQAINADYAKKSELTAAETRLQSSINAVNDALNAIDLSKYATKEELVGYATTDEVDAKLLLKANVNALANKADKDVVQNLENNISNITNNYLTKTDAQNTYVTQEVANNTYMTEHQVVQQITSVVGTDTSGLKKQVADNAAAIATKADKSELSDYAKVADVNAELAKKANASELEGLVTSEELAGLRTDLEAEIAKKQASGDYATADALTAISNSLADYAKTSNVYTKAQVDELIAGAASGGDIDLSGYATTSALEALTALVSGNATEIETLKNAGYQTAGQVETAIATATADLATKTDLGDYALKTEVPAVEDFATKDELAGYMTVPGNPGSAGKYLLSATCTSKKCNYSWALTSSVVGGSNGDVGDM